MIKGRPWTREESILAFDLYCRTPFGRLHRTNPEIVRLAEQLHRTPSSLAMRCCNFASLDPAERARGISGLQSASELDRQVFSEFAHDITKLDLAKESCAARLQIILPGEVEPGEAIADDERAVARLVGFRGAQESVSTQRVRRLSALFRRVVLVSYETACAFCDINVEPLLDAAHIVPWGEQPDARLDPANGMAMCCLHHRAFDKGFVTVDEELRIVVSKQLRVEKAGECHRVALLEIQGKKLRLPRRFAPSAECFEHHRRVRFKS